MYPIFSALLLDIVEILKVLIPLVLVFEITGDLLWK